MDGVRMQNLIQLVLAWGLRVCTSDELPSDTYAARLWTTHGEGGSRIHGSHCLFTESQSFVSFPYVEQYFPYWIMSISSDIVTALMIPIS